MSDDALIGGIEKRKIVLVDYDPRAGIAGGRQCGLTMHSTGAPLSAHHTMQ
jgi:hypothetical protein